MLGEVFPVFDLVIFKLHVYTPLAYLVKVGGRRTEYWGLRGPEGREEISPAPTGSGLGAW
jgi:hypothetical protein